MWNWFTYFLTVVMALLLVVGGSVCGCAHAHAMDFSHDENVSEPVASDASLGCGCPHGGSSDDEESDSECGCGCDEIGENTRPVDVESAEVALATDNPLDGLNLPVLQPRFQALLAVWFADFLEPFVVRESEPVARFVDPGPPGIDVPIYLQVQNLRL